MQQLALISADVCTYRIRIVRRLPDPDRSPNLYALKAEAREGLCIVCEAELPESKGHKPRTDLCGDHGCKLVYDQTCWMDHVHRQKTRAARHLRKVGAR